MKKYILLLILSSFFFGLSAMEKQLSQEKQPTQSIQSVLLVMRLRNAAFVQSVAQSNINRTLTLLSLGTININFQDGTGRTGLHYAARNNIYNLTEMLFHMGADPAIKDNAGDTAGTLAQKEGLRDLALFLERAQ